MHGSLLMRLFSRANPNNSASGSCVMERLGSVSHHQLHDEVHHDQVGPEIDQHFADHLVQTTTSASCHSVATATNDQHTFHPISEGLQVIKIAFSKKSCISYLNYNYFSGHRG